MGTDDAKLTPLESSIAMTKKIHEERIKATPFFQLGGSLTFFSIGVVGINLTPDHYFSLLSHT